MEDVLGFCTLVMTVLTGLMLSVWLCCSIVERFIRMRRRLKRAGYSVLLRQNEHLKSSLADAVEENFRLRKGYHSDLLRRKAGRVSQKVV
jgi:hypothetical protein